MNTDQLLQILKDHGKFYEPLISKNLHELRNANITINVNPDGYLKVRVEEVVFHYNKK